MNKRSVAFWFCLLLKAVPFYLLAQSQNGPVAAWNFNNGTAEHLEKFRGAAVGVSFVEDRFGNKKSSAYVHGNHGSYINLGTSPLLKPRRATLSLWVNIDIPMYGGQGTEINPFIITKNSRRDDFFETYNVCYDFGVEKLAASTTLGEERQVTLHASSEFPIRKWHHVVLTYDDDFTCLYLNGQLEVKMSKNFVSVFDPLDSVMVGNTANKKNERFLCGSIDDIAIYDRVLGPAEVFDLYTAPDFNRVNKTLRYVYWLLAFLALAALITWLMMWRYRRHLAVQEERNKTNARLNELETKAIRTQMNPHFIFNSLNTLQRFILEEDISSSHKYLTRFSKLLRQLIESSVSDSISVHEEMEIIEGYVQLERMRFDNSFQYSIRSNIESPKQVFVPFMLLQPFVENAIWHGLLHKEGDRLLQVTLDELDQARLICTVEDNGVGRYSKERSNDPVKKKSLAIDFVRQRLNLLRQSSGVDCSFTIYDKHDVAGKSAGTSVTIIIPKLKNHDAFSYHR